MYEYMIMQYIKTMTTDDIQNYAKQKGITISDHDAKILLETAKNHWSVFYKGDPTSIIEELRKKLEPATFDACLLLYTDMKKKI